PSGAYYDATAASYDYDYSTPYWQLYYDLTWRNMREHMPASGRILDAGGGTGIFALRMAKAGYDVTLVDVSDGMLDVARRKAKDQSIRVRILRQDVCSMDALQDNAYDVIICQGDVLSYCGDHGKAIAELVRVARPGAVIIASVDNIYPSIRHALETCNGAGLDDVRLLLEKGMTSYFGRFPVKTFHADELRDCFRKAGCTVKSLIGKPVLLGFMKRKDADNMLLDQRFYEQMLALELEYCRREPYNLFGGHLEIVAMKEGTLRGFL
ncbi:hypothetical protein COV94_02760, partial [Candidatus Woesearchaeota archaeon CG11_big_fil_rev_8_21_14_0_20_57_5]